MSHCPAFQEIKSRLESFQHPTLMPMMSEMGETSSWAARRGNTDREKAEAPWKGFHTNIVWQVEREISKVIHICIRVTSTHRNDMCVFELVLGGDEKGGEVLGQEASVGGRVGKQDLRICFFWKISGLPHLLPWRHQQPRQPPWPQQHNQSLPPGSSPVDNKVTRKSKGCQSQQPLLPAVQQLSRRARLRRWASRCCALRWSGCSATWK